MKQQKRNTNVKKQTKKIRQTIRHAGFHEEFIRGGTKGSTGSNEPTISEPPTPFCEKFKDITPQITEPYELGKVLGKGGFGSVYEITMNGQKYAAKHIRSNTKDKHIKKIIDETKILQAISNKCKDPGFVVCFEGIICENDKNTIYIITELLDTNYVEMKKYIKKDELEDLLFNIQSALSGTISTTGKNETVENISVENVYNIIHSLCSGLISIHDSNIAHRDIKPANIKVNTIDSTIKYLDFGLSTKVDKDGNFEFGQPFDKLTGTVGYIDPLYHVGEPQDFEKIKNYDYFSLGIVIFELIVKHLKQTDKKFKTNDLYTPYDCVKKGAYKEGFYDNIKFLKEPKIKKVINHYNNEIKTLTPPNLYSVDLIQLLTPSDKRADGFIPPQ